MARDFLLHRVERLVSSLMASFFLYLSKEVIADLFSDVDQLFFSHFCYNCVEVMNLNQRRKKTDQKLQTLR